MSRFVIKVGSSLVTDNGDCVDTEIVSRWAKQLSRLKAEKHDLILVTSGAVAEGFRILGLKDYERADVSKRRAAASVGQIELIRVYEIIFSQYNMGLSQFLITKSDFDSGTQRANLKRCLAHTLRLGRIPVFNENDAISDIGNLLGNNDILGANVARLIGAQSYIILTDCDGVYTDDPTINKEAKIISEVPVHEIGSLFEVAGGSSNKISKGGMFTKIEAAKFCAEHGVSVYIANGRTDRVIEKIASGENPGTKISSAHPLVEKEYFLDEYFCVGTIWVSANSEKYAISDTWDLLPAGITRCEGEFLAGDTVRIRTEATDQIISYGVINYDYSDLVNVKGKHEEQIIQILPSRKRTNSDTNKKGNRLKRMEAISRNEKKPQPLTR